MQRAEIVTGASVAVVGSFALVTAVNLTFLADRGVPGPGFFPTLLSGLLILLGVLLAVSGLRPKPMDADLDDDEPEARTEPAAGLTGFRRAGAVWVCFLVSVPLLSLLGFVPTMALLIAVLVFGIERRRNWRALAAAILIPVGVFELFVHVLAIPLPIGLFNLGPLGS